ncbi:MAG: hypothetical protein U1E14_02585 [Geminicoccaceae bacterium]
MTAPLPFLAGCGLRPLHAGSEGEAIDAELAAVAVTAPEDRLGQFLKNDLLDDFNPRGIVVDPKYDLKVRLQRTRNALIIQLNDDITRYDMVLVAFYELSRRSDGMVVYRSATRRSASYNQRRAPFATLVSQQNAEDRAAREISDFIRTQIALYFSRKPA